MKYLKYIFFMIFFAGTRRTEGLSEQVDQLHTWMAAALYRAAERDAIVLQERTRKRFRMPRID